MRLCVPTMDEGGVAGRLSSHFGRAPYFTLVESETGRAEVRPNLRAEHEHGRCDAARGLEGLGVDAVVCRGLGRRALAGLEDRGIPVYVTRASTVAAAVADYRGGRADPLTVEGTCRGDDH